MIIVCLGQLGEIKLLIVTATWPLAKCVDASFLFSFLQVNEGSCMWKIASLTFDPFITPS